VRYAGIWQVRRPRCNGAEGLGKGDSVFDCCGDGLWAQAVGLPPCLDDEMLRVRFARLCPIRS